MLSSSDFLINQLDRESLHFKGDVFAFMINNKLHYIDNKGNVADKKLLIAILNGYEIETRDKCAVNY